MMKKVVLTSFVVCSFLSSFGQFNKGRILIGGTGALSFKTDKTRSGNTTTTTGKTTIFSLAPTVGYFFVDNFAAGLGVAFGRSIYKNEMSGNSTNAQSIVVAPFVRYYLKPGIFFEATYGIGPAKISQPGVADTSSTLSKWSLGVGYAWFLNDHVAVEPTINYGSLASKTGSNKYTDSGINFGLGIQVYLGAK